MVFSSAWEGLLSALGLLTDKGANISAAHYKISEGSVDLGLIWFLDVRPIESMGVLVGGQHSTVSMKRRIKGSIIVVCISLVVSIVISVSIFSYHPTPLYTVTFQEDGGCTDQGPYFRPWGVTLGTQTLTQPPGATITPPYGGGYVGDLNVSDRAIVFRIPNGTYQYQLLGAFSPSSGTVIVNDTAVVIRFSIFMPSCPVPYTP